MFSESLKDLRGLPCLLRGKGSACQHRRHKGWESSPWVRRSPRVGNAPRSSPLAWEFPWAEEPGGLISLKKIKNFKYTAACVYENHFRRVWLCNPMDCSPSEPPGKPPNFLLAGFQRWQWQLHRCPATGKNDNGDGREGIKLATLHNCSQVPCFGKFTKNIGTCDYNTRTPPRAMKGFIQVRKPWS